MAAFVYPVDNQTRYQAANVTQILDYIRNQFGDSDSAPTNLGRLALPYVTADPATPVNGQIWYRSDLAQLFLRASGISSKLWTLAQAPILYTATAVNLTAAQDSAIGVGQAFTTHGGIVLALGAVNVAEVKSGAAQKAHVAGFARKTSAFTSGGNVSPNQVVSGFEPQAYDYQGGAGSAVSTIFSCYFDTPAANTYYYVPYGLYSTASTSGTPTGACWMLLIEFAP